MIQVKSLEDIIVPFFGREHIAFFEDIITLYQNDILNLDPLAYDPLPKYSHLQLQMCTSKSWVDIMKYIISIIEAHNKVLHVEEENAPPQLPI